MQDDIACDVIKIGNVTRNKVQELEVMLGYNMQSEH